MLRTVHDPLPCYDVHREYKSVFDPVNSSELFGPTSVKTLRCSV